MILCNKQFIIAFVITDKGVVLGKIFSYIVSNLREEIQNFPLFIPVFIGLGIGYYFHLYNEPKTWVVNLVFIISSLILLFVNFGNSSDKVKHYKLLVILSTFKYIIKKVLKFALFALLFPIVGHITLFILIGSWFVSILEYSYYLKYFALIYDNSLMKGIWKVIKFIFRPITNRFQKTKLSKYSKDVVKTSHNKKKPAHKVFRLLIKKTKLLTGFVFGGIFNNPLVRFIIRIKRIVRRNVVRFFRRTVGLVFKYVPENVVNGCVRFVVSFNYVLFFFILGVFVIKLKTNVLNTYLLDKNIKNTQITARVISSENFENQYRLTFDKVQVVDGENVPLNKIRVKFDKSFGLPEMGKTLTFNASLIPPFEPITVGGFDFARYSYYKELSASGRSFDGWKYSEVQIKNSFFENLFFKFLDLRNRINSTVERDTSKDVSGVIMSMMTGERYSISDDISEAYKGAGISHMLAISGFHMTLIVGFAFFVVRLILACWMPLSNRYNTKKIAVVFALMFSVFYLFVSGARLPTQRAFIMTTLALIAVLIDRSPFSLRFIAVSAIIILLLSPEALVNAGFQMSFVAVVSLIKLYEKRESWIIPNNDYESPFRTKAIKLLNTFWATSLTSFFTGLAIAPFVVYNFNTVQLYSVLGNFFGIPLFSFVVMPAILFAFLTMPFGLEWLFLKVAELGVDGINFFAFRVSALPYASIDVKSMSLFSLMFILLGMIWFFLWSQKWKKLGLVFICLGLVSYVFTKNPNLLVDKYGTLFGVVEKDKIVVVSKSKYPPAKMTLDGWSQHTGIKNIEQSSQDNFNLNGVNVSFVSQYKDYKDACLNSDVLFTTFYKNKAFFKCKKRVFDKSFLRRARGAEFFFDDKKVKFRTVKNYIGNRPWVYGYTPNKNDDSFSNVLKTFD